MKGLPSNRKKMPSSPVPIGWWFHKALKTWGITQGELPREMARNLHSLYGNRGFQDIE